VDLTIEAASLDMDDQAVRDDALSPAFLDAAAFPSLAYHGSCAAGSVEGLLTLHGVTRPLGLALAREADRVVAPGTIHRAAWGIAGRPVLAGPNVVIRISLPLPEAARTALAHVLAAAPAR
jgi:polyisoprenoid-binding protein YceI